MQRFKVRLKTTTNFRAGAAVAAASEVTDTLWRLVQRIVRRTLPLTVGPFFKLLQIIIDRVPLGFGSNKLMILRNNAAIIVQGSNADVGKLWKCGVFSEQRGSAFPTEFLRQAICNVISRYLAQSMSNTQI
jgi:hypothetical protein